MRIAVVIPTYNRHLPYIPRALHSIQHQTRHPELVVLCASSCPPEWKASLDLTSYTFPIEIYTTEELQSAGQNRNKGISHIDTTYDIVSFFDSDDVMHPNRLEYIEQCFQDDGGETDVVLHSACLTELSVPYESIEWESTIPLTIHRDCTDFKYGLHRTAYLKTPIELSRAACTKDIFIVNGSPSVRRQCLDSIQYEEAFTACEDTIFVSDLFKYGYTIVYIENKLLSYSQINSEEKDIEKISEILDELDESTQ